jgi:uncharacterized protein (DUF488 family)
VQLFTVGHGTASPESFLDLLHSAGIVRIVDVRSVPGSRRFPWFRGEEMERWLARAGIAYRSEKALGGFRKPQRDSPHTALRVSAFRGYADHMDTAEFWAALDFVLREAAEERTAVLCSESLWWRCHRRLLADAATIVRGVEVLHLGHDGRTTPHGPTDGVRRDDDRLVYDAGRATLGSSGGTGVRGPEPSG